MIAFASNMKRYIFIICMFSMVILFFPGTVQGQWSKWVSVGGAIPPGEPPAVCSQGDGTMDLFSRNYKGQIIHRHFDGTNWKVWKNLGFSSACPVTCVATGNKHIELFGRNGNRHLIQRSFDGQTWSGWKNLGGKLLSSPSACFDGTRIHVYANCVRPDWSKGYMRRIANNGTWGNWLKFDAPKGPGFPPALASAGGRLYVFVVTGPNSNTIGRFFEAGQWSKWFNLGGFSNAAPAACSSGDGSIYIFIRNGRFAIAFREWNAVEKKWSSGWSSLGGYLNSSPAAVSRGGGKLDVFARKDFIVRKFRGEPTGN